MTTQSHRLSKLTLLHAGVLAAAVLGFGPALFQPAHAQQAGQEAEEKDTLLEGLALRALPAKLVLRDRVQRRTAEARIEAERYGLSASSTRQYVAAAVAIEERRVELINNAHARRDLLVEEAVKIARTLTRERIRDDADSNPTVLYIIGAAQMRQRDLIALSRMTEEQLAEADDSAFKRLLKASRSDGPATLEQVERMRALLDEHNPWRVGQDVRAVQATLRETVKNFMTPEEYVAYLRGIGADNPPGDDGERADAFVRHVSRMRLNPDQRDRVRRILVNSSLDAVGKREQIERILTAAQKEDVAAAIERQFGPAKDE